MAENQSRDINPELKNEEIENPSYPNMHSEPGDHGQAAFSISRMQAHQAMKEGEVAKTFFWNRGLTKRVTSYQPRILAIDGLVAHADEEIGLQTAWGALPGRPSQINRAENSILVVRGDVDYFGLPLEGISDNDQNDTVMGKFQRQYFKEVTKEDDYLETDVLLGITFLLDMAVAGGYGLQKYRATQEGRQQNKITRRQFLKTAAWASGLTLPTLAALFYNQSRFLGPRLASLTTTTSEKIQLQKVVDVVKPRIFKNEWTEFRTALLIAKLEDAIDYLQLPKDISSAVLYGNLHEFGAIPLMKDPAHRREVISHFTSNLLGMLDQASQGTPSFPLEEAKAMLKIYLAKAEVIRIDDPGPAEIVPNLAKKVPELIHHQSDLSCPKVMEAIKDLS